MNRYYFPYELRFKNGGSHSGALLKFELEEGVGYADCHPWPELGDLPLQSQLSLLQKGSFTTLTLSSSLYFAKIDASARSNKKNLFEGLYVPKSHMLIYDINEVDINLIEKILEAGFTSVKVKVGRNIKQEIQKLLSMTKYPLKWRLDFNARVAFEDYISMVSELRDLNIEFVEDPFPFDHQKWCQAEKITRIPLAVDRFIEKDVSDSDRIWVIKPAVGDGEKNLSQHRFTVTSYLDHPLGQASAAYMAAKLSAKYSDHCLICGLLSHYVYESTPFTSQENNRLSAKFSIPEGTGLGYDDLLRNLNWRKL
ncbi:MAG: enolase C-terminal domain-like protein [Chlamydiota bacterium]|nr:enolase C-terminal domain-like protein [Chlamydiota bacterium]